MATTFNESKMVAPQIDFNMRQTVAPRYKWLKLPLNNIPTHTVTLSNGTTQQLEFKLPTKVYNLYRSYISTTITAKETVANFAWMNEDVFDLGNSISFGGAQGVNLVDLNFAGNYSKIARRLNTTMTDYLGNDDMSGLYKCNMAASTNYLPATGGKTSDNFFETQYASSGTAVNLPLSRYRQYPLSMFAGTLLGVDRDFYAPVEQYLRIMAGIPERTTWTATSGTDPATGAANNADGVKYSDIYLYLCVEQNPDIIMGMIKRYESKQMVYRIPFTTGFKTVGTAAGSLSNISIQLPQQYGKRLKRIMHTPYNPVETKNTAFDCDNTNGAKITNYQTFLDSQQLQDHVLSCARPTLPAGTCNRSMTLLLVEHK
jgi:hypothetical protein